MDSSETVDDDESRVTLHDIIGVFDPLIDGGGPLADTLMPHGYLSKFAAFPQMQHRDGTHVALAARRSHLGHGPALTNLRVYVSHARVNIRLPTMIRRHVVSSNFILINVEKRRATFVPVELEVHGMQRKGQVERHIADSCRLN